MLGCDFIFQTRVLLVPLAFIKKKKQSALYQYLTDLDNDRYEARCLDKAVKRSPFVCEKYLSTPTKHLMSLIDVSESPVP